MREVTMYRSESGKMHETAYEAHRDDLIFLLSGAAGNDPIARQVAEAICADIGTYHTLIAGLRDTNPAAPPKIISSLHFECKTDTNVIDVRSEMERSTVHSISQV